MCVRTPETSYYHRKMRTTSRRQLIAEWEDAPITRRDREFLRNIAEGDTLKELAEKYGLSVSAVSKWKTRVFVILHRFDTRR